MTGLRLRRPKVANHSSLLASGPKSPDKNVPPRTLSPATPLSHADYIALTVLTCLAIATRFYRLATPPAVVFDELHFSKFVDRILTGTWFFDIHPPLGKLILAYGSFLLGYRADPTFVIQKIGNPYPEHVKYVLVRSVSAFFSVATVPMTYLISRNLGISSTSSILASCSVLLDFLGLIEGRLILMDSQLLFFCQLALLCALELWQTRPGTAKRRLWLTSTGIAAGAALSIKHTALATPGLIAIISFFGLHFLKDPLSLLECAWAGLCGLLFYASTFYVMFNRLWKSGGKYDKFMPMHFRRTLLGAEEYDSTAERVSFIRLFRYLNRRMVQSNASIKKRHTWESDWYQWIVNWRGVLYFLHKETKSEKTIRTQIYLLGNPVVIYVTLVCVLVFIVIALLSARYRESVRRWKRYSQLQWMRSTGIFLLSGWLCNLLPYILVDRAAFIYHYIPGLFYGQLLVGLVLDAVPSKARIPVVVVMGGSMVTAFVYWSPWIYATPMDSDQHSRRRWLPKWT
ncbi:unnamed protein product [Agarophyton chilense]